MRRRVGLLFGLLMTLTLTVAALGQSETAERPFLHPLFSDNMVLQRDSKVTIWGWTQPGAQVTVQLAGKKAESIADAEGKWAVQVGPFRAGGPHELTVTGPQTVTRSNLLFGEVWVCSGQSNMQWPVSLSDNPEQEIANANFPEIRLFIVPHTISTEPRATVSGQWQVCSPQTIPNFSAVGYFFGRMLHQTLKVPVGLINTSWGGTVAEAWTSRAALETMSDFRPALDQVGKMVAEKPNNPNIPTVLYNGMIAPLVPYRIKGAIWYQGESNAGRAVQYRTLLPTLIRDWRTRWQAGDFPFLIVQLANFLARDTEPKNDPWPNLREAQFLTTTTVPKTGLALAIDIGDEKDIHPRNKQEVGRRLALNALALAYGQRLPYSGPVYRGMKVEGDKIRLSFNYLNGGLVAKDGPLHGFAIASEDRKFVWADAVIEGDTVVVSSPQVPRPVAVRYAWSNNPVCNLYNRAGLPAVPFRTDTW